MSSARKPPTYRHSSSIEEVKIDNVTVKVSGETADALANREYYNRYPNKWARIRSATRRPVPRLRMLMDVTGS